MMKIAIDCRMINSSGIGNVLKNILFNLPKENDYLLIGEEKDILQFKASNITICSCTIPIFSIREFLFFPVREINACDIFFSPNYNIPGRIACKKICFIHDLVFLDMPELTSKIGLFIRYIYALRAVIVSKRIFTVSEFSKKRIVHYFKHENKIKVTYNSVPLQLKKFLVKSVKKVDNYFVYVGNIKKHKGLTTLIEAFNNFSDKKMKLYIVGKKENFRTAFQDIEHNINPNIVFTGWIDDERMYNLMNNATALIQPSIYEGFGIPPLEALYLNTPVIISDIPVFKECYQDFPVSFFHCGDYVDLLNQMLAVKPIKVNSEILDKKFNMYKSLEAIFSVFNDLE